MYSAQPTQSNKSILGSGGRCYHPRVAPETVNLKNFPGPQLRLPPALEEGVGWGSEGGGRGVWTRGGGVLFTFFLF